MVARMLHMHMQSYINDGVPSRLCIAFSNPAAAFTALSCIKLHRAATHIALLSSRSTLHNVLTVMRSRHSLIWLMLSCEAGTH